jgi:hypothetical protein
MTNVSSCLDICPQTVRKPKRISVSIAGYPTNIRTGTYKTAARNDEENECGMYIDDKSTCVRSVNPDGLRMCSSHNSVSVSITGSKHKAVYNLPFGA